MNELSNISFDWVCKKLAQANSVLILTHMRPDGDTLGSGFALRELLRGLGKRAEVINSDVVPKRLRFVFGEESLSKDSLPSDFTPDLVVSVDVSAASLLGELEGEYGRCCDLAIDHHVLGMPFAKCTYVGNTGSCGEIISDIFEYFGKEGKNLLTRPAATALYTAISSDTGSFKYDSVTGETHRRVAKLLEVGINHAQISRRLYDSHPMSEIVGTKLALDTLKFYHGGKIATVYFTKAMLKDNNLNREDIDDIIGLTRGIEGVEVGISIKQNEVDETLYKVSMRSNSVADVAKLCALFGGGGHVRAGGCSIKAGSVEEAQTLLVSAVETEISRLEAEGAFDGIGEI